MTAILYKTNYQTLLHIHSFRSFHISKWCEIWVIHNGEDSSHLLGCDAV